MRRRELLTFLTLLIGGVVAWPPVFRAKSPSVPVIGFLNIGSPQAFAAFAGAFHEGLGIEVPYPLLVAANELIE